MGQYGSFTSHRDSQKKGTDLGESTCGCASAVPEPGANWTKFLTWREQVGSTLSALTTPAYCTANKAWIQSYFKMRHASLKSGQKRAHIGTVYAWLKTDVIFLHSLLCRYNLNKCTVRYFWWCWVERRCPVWVLCLWAAMNKCCWLYLWSLCKKTKQNKTKQTNKQKNKPFVWDGPLSRSRYMLPVISTVFLSFVKASSETLDILTWECDPLCCLFLFHSVSVCLPREHMSTHVQCQMNPVIYLEEGQKCPNADWYTKRYARQSGVLRFTFFYFSLQHPHESQ